MNYNDLRNAKQTLTLSVSDLAIIFRASVKTVCSLLKGNKDFGVYTDDVRYLIHEASKVQEDISGYIRSSRSGKTLLQTLIDHEPIDTALRSIQQRKYAILQEAIGS